MNSIRYESYCSNWSILGKKRQQLEKILSLKKEQPLFGWTIIFIIILTFILNLLVSHLKIYKGFKLKTYFSFQTITMGRERVQYIARRTLVWVRSRPPCMPRYVLSSLFPPSGYFLRYAMGIFDDENNACRTTTSIRNWKMWKYSRESEIIAKRSSSSLR